MASEPIPGGTVGAGGGSRERRTRPADRLTEAFLVATAILAVWSVVLTVLTVLEIAAPGLYSLEKAPLKAAGATVVGLLAVGQLWSMETILGHLPRGRLRIRTLMRAHRYGGRLAIMLAIVVAYFCMTDVGVQTSQERAAIHGFFGSTAFVAIAVKLALIRFRPRLAYDLAPWLGRYAAVAFIIVWITSAYAFYVGAL